MIAAELQSMIVTGLQAVRIWREVKFPSRGLLPFRSTVHSITSSYEVIPPRNYTTGGKAVISVASPSNSAHIRSTK